LRDGASMAMEVCVGEFSSFRFVKGLSLAGVACIVAVLAVALLPPRSFAQADTEEPAGLQVGTVAAPPFAMKTEGGAWEGLSIDLWQAVASALGAQYEVREYGTFEQLLDALAKENLYVAIGLAATSFAATAVDFIK